MTTTDDFAAHLAELRAALKGEHPGPCPGDPPGAPLPAPADAADHDVCPVAVSL